MIPIHSIFPEELEARLVATGEQAYRVDQIFAWLYRQRVKGFEEMSNLSARLRGWLQQEYCYSQIECLRGLGSGDATRKMLFKLEDGQLIESVLIPASPALYGTAADRRTACISTQVGCAYGCKFCASGLDGFSRNLVAGEIVEQLIGIERASGEKINNIVFMGMGEPLANYANLIRAITIINSPWGLNIGARHITVSTSGLAPQVKQLADQPLQIRLAISLHGATDEVRDRIMPVNRKYNLATLFEACAYFRSRKKQKITFEYILIDQVNDGLDQAEALVHHARRLDAKVNLIPYNTVEGLDWQRPSVTRQNRFHKVLRDAGIPATIRREKGHDIEAACGQLRRQTINKV